MQREQKALVISNLALLLVVFVSDGRRKYDSERVKDALKGDAPTSVA